MSANLGVWLRIRPLRIQYVIDYVDDAVGDQYVGCEQLRRVNIEVVSIVHDSDILSIQSEELGVVGETGRIDYLREYCIFEDLGELLGCQAGNGRTEGLKSLVRRDKNCDIGGIKSNINDSCCVQSAFKCGEIKSVGRIGEVGWRD